LKSCGFLLVNTHILLTSHSSYFYYYSKSLNACSIISITIINLSHNSNPKSVAYVGTVGVAFEL